MARHTGRLRVARRVATSQQKEKRKSMKAHRKVSGKRIQIQRYRTIYSIPDVLHRTYVKH